MSLIDESLGPNPDAVLAGPVICAQRLPKPPSTNLLYQPRGRGKKMRTAEYEAFRSAVQFQLLAARGVLNAAPSRARLGLAIRTHLRSGDIGNFEKAVADAMEGIVYVNDNQIDRTLLVRGWPLAPACVDVWVCELQVTERSGEVEFREA